MEGVVGESFKDIAIVACGTMSPEINNLKQLGFLDTEHIFFTTPGLHQDIPELETQLVRLIEKGKSVARGVIVVYGGKYCYVNPDNPTRLMKDIIGEQGSNVVRIEASHCMGMMATEQQMKQITTDLGGEPVWFMTPGWVKFKKQVFKGWDKAIANENFPRHTGGAVVLDGIEYMDQYMTENPEEFLDYCDWMGIPMQGAPVSMDRFKGLLTDALAALNR
ncbi:MAG: DUF1638 domain-containing protein [Proteobacteria bacterium]|nr:DUF1638 domain-containing protein [Pseudomonadota bacterium]MBU1389766.1 DUF1638 domain-containing protein [Pseudomonadota bacterium]MBU1543775.1 DUF1638 domain-containing protein [Pseudomonadota bacterium]MBU2480130.1 DUF1638 domain-containing protein [Pseudomonadota bacterium]